MGPSSDTVSAVNLLKNQRTTPWGGLSLCAMLLVAAGCPGDDVSGVTGVDTATGGSSGSGDSGGVTITPSADSGEGDGSAGDSDGPDSTAGDTGADSTGGDTGGDSTGAGSTGGDDSTGAGSDGAMCGDDDECDGRNLNGEDCVSLGFEGGRLSCLDDCTFDTSACTMRLCGNDTIAGLEVCDGADLDGEDCISQGFDGGALGCEADCAAFDTSQCTTILCGDDLAEGGEACDGADLGGEDCTTQGFDGGVLGCAPDCSALDTSGCMNNPGVCGDDAIDGMEVCDGADLAGEDCISQGFAGGGVLGCAADCTGFDTAGCMGIGGGCGDDMIDGMEVCDGADLAGEDCISQGFAGGALGCAGDCSGFDTAGCMGGGPDSDCCTESPTGTPGCLDPACEATVCAGDAFCCDNQWDGICADAAAVECPGLCGGGGACGDDMIDGMEVCDGADLAGEDCVSQGFAGGVLGCAGDCSGFDTAGCMGAGGPDSDCCTPSPTGTPGCLDPACEATVCAADAFCCDNEWDGICADTAAVECPGLCGGGGGVCGDDMIDGMEVCDGADLAGEDCVSQGFAGGVLGCAGDCSGFDTAGCMAGGGPDSDCCTESPTGTPGCTDPACEAAVCAVDSFCCDTDWDGICADTAGAECPALCPAP